MKRFLFVLSAIISMTSMAQSKFGYVSYIEIVKAFPEYSLVEAHLDELQAKYEAEIERSDREFNQKYIDFIEEQSQFPDNIRIKRHKELQQLMKISMEFKEEVNRAMREARKEMMRPIYEKVEEAALKVCVDGGYDYILNTDDRMYIAINPNNGVDITEQLKKELQIETTASSDITESDTP